MTQDSFNGGRGKVAPYQSTHIRVPDTIKTQLQKIVEAYRKLLAKNSKSGLSSFELHLDKFVEGVNPLYGVTADDFKLVSTSQFNELQTLHDLSTANTKKLKRDIESLKFEKKEAVRILQAALKLKANSGGAIKEEIRKALGQLDEEF